MKSGWVISVSDITLKDQVYKMFIESRDVINKKISIIKDKYDSIEKDRFRVIVAAPYSEIDISNNKFIRCEKREGLSTKDLLELLVEVDAFVVKEELTSAIFGICEHHLAHLVTLLADVKHELVESA